MKNHVDDSVDLSDFVVVASPAQGSSSVIGGGPPPAPVLGPPIDVSDEVREAQAAFAASGDGGPGSVVSVSGPASAGLTINLIFDSAAMAAPQSFRDGITAAMQQICTVVTDKITINIQIDYSGSGGGAFAGPTGGNYVGYSTVRADLVNNASPGDTTFNALPTGSTFAGQSQVAVWYAQEKLWGLISPTGTEVDGSATFSTDINPNLLVGVALHELTHAMGRVPYGSQPDVFDFYRFTSPGTNLLSGSSTAPAAYFSLNNGATKLADYGQTSDPSDFLNSGVQGSTDPFNEFYSGSTQQQLTAMDLKQLDALGFHLVSNQQTQTVIESFGSTKLVEVGNNYFFNPVAGGTGPELMYQGAPVTTGEFSGWVPLGVEPISNGYEMAWHNTVTGLYTVWSTDSSGNYITNTYMPGSGTSVTFESLETSFHQDLNGDGTIGIPATQPSTTIEAYGATAVVQTGNNYFFNPVAGGTGPELSYHGAHVTAGQFAPYTLIAAEQVTGGGYDVAWKDPGSGLYIIWNLDSSGNYLSHLVAGSTGTGVLGNTATLESYEPIFHQDLNGDGVIGVPGSAGAGTAIEASGSTAAVQIGNNYFLNTVGGGAGPELSYHGVPITAGQFAPYTLIGAEQVAGGYDIAWKDPGSGLYIIWNVDSNGNYVTHLAASVLGNTTTLESYEPIFHQDLNGDGTIGIPAHTAPAAQVASTVPVAQAAPSLGGGDSFAFRPDLGSGAAASGPAQAALHQFEQLAASAIEHFGTELQHIIGGALSELTDAHDNTAHGSLIDLLHGFIIH